MKQPGIGFLSKALGAVLVAATPFVATHEGVSLVAYLDPVHVPTICYGSTKGVSLGQSKTQEECDSLLAEELAHFIKAVDDLTLVDLPEPTHVALASFAYNVGVSNFQQSTLLKKLNAGDIAGACNELPRWVYAKGIKWPGLVVRRREEQKLCLMGVTNADL